MIEDSKKLLRFGSLTIFFIIVAVYAFFGSQDLIFGVKIKNVNIVDGATLANPIMEIKGNAKNAINLTLNGREISIDVSGDFTETIALLPGYNIISIKARDKFGDVDEKDYKLMYKAENI